MWRLVRQEGDFLAAKLKTLATMDINDGRRILPRFQSQNLTCNLSIIEILEKMACKKNCTPVQISLAWILAQGEKITAIPGTKRISYLEENCGAVSVVLSKEELAMLGNEIPLDFAKGHRMPENFVQFSDN